MSGTDAVKTEAADRPPCDHSLYVHSTGGYLESTRRLCPGCNKMVWM